mgnify:CR=1 FL=1
MRLTLVTALFSCFAKAAEDTDYLLKDIIYDPKLGCGECVAGGYSFCWKATSSGEVLSEKEYPKYNSNPSVRTSVCCKDNKDA